MNRRLVITLLAMCLVCLFATGCPRKHHGEGHDGGGPDGGHHRGHPN